MEPNSQSQSVQAQGQVQNSETPAPNPQVGEGIGMSKSFSENPSMEMLNNRRIDQIVSAREQERARAVQAVQDAQTQGHNDGLRVGRDQGLEVGFLKGHMDGQEHGKQQVLNSGSAVPSQGLGSSLPIQQIQ